MGKREFTPEQKAAIATRDKTLLVSAAAGSGKTATLTERIIQSITDKNNPESISDMLIVTFTNAAVKELKERITGALKSAIAENPNDSRLEKQIHLLGGARICTIDSFCNELLKSNTEKYGISPNYRIADQIEAEILSRSVLSGLIDAVYDGDLSDEVATPEEFEELCSALVGVKSDSKLEDEFLLLCKKTDSIEKGNKIFSEFAKAYHEESTLPVEENRFGEFVIALLNEGAAHYEGLYRAISEKLDAKDKTEEKYIDLVEKDCELLCKIQEKKTYIELKDLLCGHVFPSAPSVRGEKSEAILELLTLRNEMKDFITKKIIDKYFIYSENEWQDNLRSLSKMLSILGKFLEKFDTAYMEEKKRRSMLEYSDIERLAYMSLYENGKPGELALALREQFSSVYVDEYQDVNEIQSKIFKAIAKDNNRFMVGDIKQSIYGFRSAKPSIFAGMKEAFPPLESSADSSTASIFMSKNFRCDKSIVDFVNGIFDTMFTVAKESIGYVDSDRLEYAKIQDSTPPVREPEICLFAKDAKEFFCKDEEESEEDVLKTLAPKWAAAKILELIKNGVKNDGTPIEKKDVAILLRKDSGRCKAYKDALTEAGVNARIPEDKDFFLNAEIQLAICLLNAIDNPERDIYLAGLMRSPLYDFTADELFLIRRFGDGDSLWEALNSYSRENDFIKGREFISAINRYRIIAEGMPTDKLMQKLYTDTGLLALASKNGRRDNLMILYDYARKFEASSFQGLFNFINYVNTVINTGAKFSTASQDAEDDAVTITTIHKSKGLEYPVVILADAGADLLSSMDRRVKMPFAEELGAALKLRVDGGLALVESPIFNAILDYNDGGSLEEELRVYYVALTRAREQLIITGAIKEDTLNESISKNESRRGYISKFTLRQMKTFADLLLFSRKSGTILSPEEEIKKIGTVEGVSQKSPEQEKKGLPKKGELYDAFAKRFSYKYPTPEMTLLPQKLSVSKLYPTVLDGNDDEVSLTLDVDAEDTVDERGILPDFMESGKADESAKKGIATHLVLQFCNLDSLSALGAEGELERLSSEGFISKEDKKRVRIDELRKFTQSKLYAEMKNARALYREFRFNVMLPASIFTADEEKKKAYSKEKILAQGVIDCLIEDENGSLHLVDYKTDRLTREELRDPELARQTLAKKHSLQLSYYALAVERIFGKMPSTVRVYSLPLGDTVDV